MLYRMKTVSNKVSLMFCVCVHTHTRTHTSQGITFWTYSSDQLWGVGAAESPYESIREYLPHSFLNSALCTLFFYIPLLSGWCQLKAKTRQVLKFFLLFPMQSVLCGSVTGSISHFWIIRFQCILFSVESRPFCNTQVPSSWFWVQACAAELARGPNDLKG